MVAPHPITAAGIVIGDELLSGKVQDANAGVLIRQLRSRGVALQRLATVGDNPEDIAHELRRCSDQFDWVFTSGGVGPTHDDRTMEGAARAFDCRLVRPRALEQAVRAHMGDAMNESSLKLAEVPEGARLLEEGAFPVVALRNVFLLPGVPEIFAHKLERVCQQFTGEPPTLQRLFLIAPETAVAAELEHAQQTHPTVRIGSYPLLEGGDFNLLVTVEGSNASAVKQAVAQLLDLLPPRVVHSVSPESPDSGSGP